MPFPQKCFCVNFHFSIWTWQSLYAIIDINMHRTSDLSRLRQGLVRLRDELGRLLEIFLAREPLVKGSVYALRRKCGKPTCACTRGELHGTVVVSWSEAGRTRLATLPPGRRGDLRASVRQYQRFRRARARLVKLHGEMLVRIDALDAGRREAP